MEAVIPLIQWMVKSGLFSATEIVVIVLSLGTVVFIHRSHKESCKEDREVLIKAHEEVKSVMQSQIEEQQGYIKNSEERYKMLRADLEDIQEHVADCQRTMLYEILDAIRRRS